MVYAAATAALAVLEVRVHLDLPPELLPDDYVLATIDLGDAAIEHLAVLPDQTAAIGDEWLRAQRTPVLQVPSVIVPESANLLINPAHPDAGSIRVAGQRRFTFDPRLWMRATP